LEADLAAIFSNLTYFNHFANKKNSMLFPENIDTSICRAKWYFADRSISETAFRLERFCFGRRYTPAQNAMVYTRSRQSFALQETA